MNKRVKKRVFDVIQNSEGTAGKAFDLFIIALIIISVVSIIADTFTLPKSVKSIFYYTDLISIIIFTIEYVLRIWVSDLIRPEMKPAKARLRYAFSFMALIDLLSILPFYVPLMVHLDLRVLRMLRMIRLLRIFKVSRYTSALATIADVFKRKSSQLISSTFVVSILMVISSVLMYNVEHQAQPEVFKNAFSGLWWAVSTFTTVGYGDIYPVTTSGRVLSAIIALLGIGLVAVPTGIISAGFIETVDETKQNDDEKKYCPYCGHDLG